MKTIYLTVFTLIISMSTTFAQRQTQQRPQQPVNQEKELERYEEEVEKRKQQYITDFVATLEVDEFQKEIIKQHMDSYFEGIRKINRLKLNVNDRKEYIDIFDARHFSDVKAMVSEDVMNKIMDAVKGKWDQKAEKKKNKKKRKKKDKN